MPVAAARPDPVDDRAGRLDERRLDFLATTSWAEGLRVDDALFASAAYHKRLGPAVPTLFYIAGSGWLRSLASQIGRTVFKPGVTEGGTSVLRLSSLAAARYGAGIKVEDQWIEEEGFDFFQAVALPLQRRRGRCSPVRPALRAIAIDRPASLPFNALDSAVRAGLESASLSRFATSEEALSLIQSRRLDPAVLHRYTPGPRGAGSSVRHRRATELAIIAPRGDADHIADLLERIVANHVMGTDRDSAAMP